MPQTVIDTPLLDLEGITFEAQSNADVQTNWRGVNIPFGASGMIYHTDETDNGSRVTVAPRIVKLFYYDASASAWVDLLETGLLDSQQSPSILITLAAADRIYIATDRKIAGIRIDVTTSVNNNAATMAMEYSNNKGNFVASTVTDDTASGGATLAVDGNITYNDVPTDWVKGSLQNLLRGMDGVPETLEHYWVRLNPSALLDVVAFTQIIPLHEKIETTGGYGLWARENVEYNITFDENVGAVNAIADTTAAVTVHISWLYRGG